MALLWSDANAATDPILGPAWPLKTAEQGKTEAMKELSRLYASGYGVGHSVSASTEWLTRPSKAEKMQYRVFCAILSISSQSAVAVDGYSELDT